MLMTEEAGEIASSPACAQGRRGDLSHDRRFKQTTQADLEAFLPPPVAAMLWEAFAYTDQYG